MKLIVFDIDGTLTDTAGIDDYFFKKAFKELYNIDISDETWKKYQIMTRGSDSGMAAEILRQEVNILPEPAEIKKLKSRFFKYLHKDALENPENFNPVACSPKLFNELKKRRNFCLAIATGCWKESALIKLKSAGIDSSYIPLSNADTFFTKLDIVKESIVESKRIYKTEFKSIVYIGDSQWDYKVAREIGIGFIGIDSKSNGNLLSLGVKYVLSDFCDMSAFFELLKEY